MPLWNAYPSVRETTAQDTLPALTATIEEMTASKLSGVQSPAWYWRLSALAAATSIHYLSVWSDVTIKPNANYPPRFPATAIRRRVMLVTSRWPGSALRAVIR